MGRINENNYEAFLLDHLEGNISAADLLELKRFLSEHPGISPDYDQALPVLSPGEEVLASKDDLFKQQVFLPDEEIIAFCEGLLNENERKNIEAKAATDAVLRHSIDAYLRTRLEPAELVSEKHHLYKSEDDLLLKDLSLCYFEEQLSAAAKAVHEALMTENKGLRDEQDLLARTVLSPDLQVFFPEKNTLKKKETRIFWLFDRRTAAAGIAAMLILTLGVGLKSYFPENRANGSTVVSEERANSERKDIVSQTRKPVKEEGELAAKGTEKAASPERSNSKAPRMNKLIPATGSLFAETNSTLTESQEKEPGQENQLALQDNEHRPEIKTQPAQQEPAPPAGAILNFSDLAFTEEIEEMVKEDEKRSFWKRAVAIAQQVNRLGVKSIDGQEDSRERYRLSFNSFSVEKR